MKSLCPPPLVIAHRGASGYFPENTLLAFEKAIIMGADMIELDVQICKTGELVVIHDRTVNRTTNGHGFVSKMSLKDLKKLSSGYSQKISTFEEVLNFIDKRICLNIELKGAKTAESVARIIKYYIKYKKWKPYNFIVSSFRHKEVYEFKKRLPDVKIGTIWRFFPIFNNFEESDILIVPILFVTSKFVKRVHARNKCLFVFTVNRKSRIEKMIKYNVDGILSDYPDRVLQMIKLKNKCEP